MITPENLKLILEHCKSNGVASLKSGKLELSFKQIEDKTEPKAGEPKAPVASEPTPSQLEIEAEPMPTEDDMKFWSTGEPLSTDIPTMKVQDETDRLHEI